LLWKKIEDNLQYSSVLSICAIAKNEACYFTEWIEYHMIVGVEKFYIYDNESSDNTREILQPYIEKGIVEYTFFPGKQMQKSAYRDCIKKRKYDSKWIAFIDLDEFIVPIDNQTVPQFLDKMPKFATQICIGWLNYGNSEQEKKQEGFVIERFTFANEHASYFGKQIINPRDVARVSVHKSNMIGGYTVDENANILRWHHWYFSRAKLKRNFTIEKIRINHYQIKSWEEYSLKYSRGDVNRTGIPRYNRELYDKQNFNHVLYKDLEKYVILLKRKIKT
jgi:hypothetical protein